MLVGLLSLLWGRCWGEDGCVGCLDDAMWLHGVVDLAALLLCDLI